MRNPHMDNRLNKIAALANITAYDSDATRVYIDGAPHIKHASLRKLYAELLTRIFDSAMEQTDIPTVLDLGAGEGSVTLPFLELGARVTSVDISASQLEKLQSRCKAHGDRLAVRCQDVDETLATDTAQYDVVVINSFLHHIPDYLDTLRRTIPLIKPGGQFFAFQDPLHHDGMGWLNLAFHKASYLCWRLLKGDVWGGLKRHLRRSRGVFLPDLAHDNAEYHAIRKGVDEEAISRLFEASGFHCEIVKYFSTQSSLCQPIGGALGMKNTFGIIARRKSSPASAV
jgi:SAM-dependent methyltransferase